MKIKSSKIVSVLNNVTASKDHVKGGFYSESSINFLDLHISKKKNIPKNYPELEI